MNYQEAGVNIEEGYRAVNKYRELAASTDQSAVLGGLGSFAGMFSLNEFLALNGSSRSVMQSAGEYGAPIENPVLVSGTDGVGTKLEVAFQMKKYDTVGIDCVAMCINDILCHGALPLFFLDYLACGKLDAAIAADLVKGVATGCREAGAALLGGETAEMPGFYADGKYDIAGFAVGIVDRKKIIDGHKIREGDALLGIASSGVHSNGFSLIRKVLPNLNEDFGGMPIGNALLEPTRLYVKPVLELAKSIEILGMAHITGGGFYENVPRIFYNPPKTNNGSPPLSAVIHDPFKSDYDGHWKVPPIFSRIAYGIEKHGEKNPEMGKSGDIENHILIGGEAQKAGEEILFSNPNIRKLMFNTFNMGIGFVLALAPEDIPKAAAYLEEKGFPAWKIGHVEKNQNPGERLCFV